MSRPGAGRSVTGRVHESAGAPRECAHLGHSFRESTLGGAFGFGRGRVVPGCPGWPPVGRRSFGVEGVAGRRRGSKGRPLPRPSGHRCRGRIGRHAADRARPSAPSSSRETGSSPLGDDGSPPAPPATRARVGSAPPPGAGAPPAFEERPESAPHRDRGREELEGPEVTCSSGKDPRAGRI